MRKNVAGQHVAAQMNSRTDGAPLTSGVSVFVTLDGGVQTAGLGTLTHKGNGDWDYAPTQLETNGDHLAFTFTHATGVHQTVNAHTVSYDPHDTAGLGLARLDVAVGTRSSHTPAAVRAEMDANSVDLDAIVAYVDELEARLTVARALLLDNLANLVTPVWDVLEASVLVPLSMGAKVKANLDAAVSSRAAPGAAMALTVAERGALVDKALGRSIAGGADGGRTIGQALAFLRNKWEIVAGVLTVYDVDDVTPLFTATVSRADLDAVTAFDP